MDKFVIGRAIGFIVVLLALGTIAGFYVFNNYIYEEKQVDVFKDYKTAEYRIEGKQVKLGSGAQYFGNELKTDLDNDGREDVVFLLTQQPGGSGTFYYAVAALNTERGYVGSDGYLLGDRIAPQSTNLSQNPQHKNVVVFNYADRAPGEPMTARPSVGKSAYLKLDPATMQWGIVEPDFEGEANPAQMTLGMKTWNWVETVYNNDTKVAPRIPSKFTLTFKGNTFSASTDCNGVGGEYTTKGSSITFERMMSTLMYCEGSQEQEFATMLTNVSSYHFTSKGELVFDLKFDSGVMVWR